MGKLVSTAGICVSMTGLSVAPGLGFDRDVAVNDADPGRRVSSTARQEKNVSPDPAQNCLMPTKQEVVSLCAPLSVFWAPGNGLLYWFHAYQRTVSPNSRALPHPFLTGVGSSHTTPCGCGHCPAELRSSLEGEQGKD